MTVFLGNSHCILCKLPLRGTHSHPGQWKSELQQFLLKYSEIRRSSCVCKACEDSIRRGLDGKYKGEFGLNKTSKRKQCCCVPGCGKVSEHSCADFDTICDASLSEEEVSSPLHLCSHCSHCQCVSECALCGSKSEHRAGNDKRAQLRPLTQPVYQGFVR